MNTTNNGTESAAAGHDDPRLTAYALGELAPADAAQVAALVAADPQLRAALTKIQSTVAILEHELAATPAPALPALTPAARAAILERASAPATPAAGAPRSASRAGYLWLAVFTMIPIAIALFALHGISAPQQGVASPPAGTPTALLNGSDPTPVGQVSVDMLEARAATFSLGDDTFKIPTETETILNELGSPTLTSQTGFDSRGGVDQGFPFVGKITERAGDDNLDLDPSFDPSFDIFDGRNSSSEDLEEASSLSLSTPVRRHSRFGAGLTSENVVSGQISLRDGLFFDEGREGDLRARVENFFDDQLGESRVLTESGGLNLRYHLQGELPAAAKNGPVFERTPGGESYDLVYEKPFTDVASVPLSTFSLDVDTASYANVRRMLNDGQLPPAGAVRLEEFVNSFPYGYAKPEGDAPLAAGIETIPCPWSPGHLLARIGVKAREVARDRRPPANLVFLIDVSGSMQPMNKLPLLKASLQLLLGELLPSDRIGIVVFAGDSRVVLASTPVAQKDTILAALDQLVAGGSTNGGSGIQMAYEAAAEGAKAEAFAAGGIHRVILATDGDFNVGITDRGELVELIEAKAKSGVFLTVLGFGMGNVKDATMEELSNKGNGNYAYIDSIEEAQKALVYEVMGTMLTVARDVKAQVEFNPAQVASYRLLGYANRGLAARDFADDSKDAGDVGAGHTVTAFYELVPTHAVSETGEPLKYQPHPVEPAGAYSDELFTLKLRYKLPDASASQLMTCVANTGSVKTYSEASSDTRFAAAVAAFAMLLESSPHAGNASFAQILELAGAALGEDELHHRAEFLELVKRAKRLSGN